MGSEAGADRRVEIGPGAATAIVHGEVAALVLSDAVPEPLLTAVREAAHERPAGSWLARRLGELLADSDDGLPALGVVADTDGGILLLLAGPIVATAVGTDGAVTRVSGTDASTWVDRVIAADHGSVTLAPEGEPVASDSSPFELADGVVPAGWIRRREPGFVDQPATPGGSQPEDIPPPPQPRDLPPPPAPGAGAPAASDPDTGQPPPPPPAGAGTPAASDPDTGQLPPPPPASTAPQAVAARRTMVAPAGSDGGTDAGGGPVVEGILCDRDHLNPPGSDACLACGSAIEGERQRVRRARPALGFLVFDDGATYTLDARYLLGREPASDPLVAEGQALPIPLDDPRASVSRVHAEIRLVGWDVQLLDRGSRNGTYVLREGTWEAVAAEEPRLIGPGTRVAVGQRTFVYDVSRPL